MHIWCSVIFCLMVSARYVDAAIGGNCPGGDGDCTAGNHEVCSTDGTLVCVCAAAYTDNSGTCGCGDPTAPADATVALDGDATETNEDDTATVTCDAGYEVSSGVATATIACQNDGTWTAATCSKKDCGAVSDPTDGTTALDSAGVTTYQSTATVTCDAGFELDTGTATATITCQAAGTWSTLPTCNEDCDAPLDPADGTTTLVTAGDTTFGATSTVTCDAGFGLDTNMATATITCQAGGSWSALPACTAGDAADCGAPSPPENGVISTAATANTEGHEATVACDTGYTLDGSSTMTCQHDKSWSTPGTCSGSTSVAWSFYVLLLLGVMTRLMKE